MPSNFQGNLQQTLNAFVDAITASVEATLLTGQLAGTMPMSDIGPWANGSEWWFWDQASGQYQPTDQGVPIGIVTIWGGEGVPNNWLLCDGSAVARSTYSRLFRVVGETWGPGDGMTTFNLPPGGKLFVNAPGFVPGPLVPIDSGYVGQGVNGRGGSQNFLLLEDNIPQVMVFVPMKATQFNQKPPTNKIGLACSAAESDGSNTIWEVVAPYTLLPVGFNEVPVGTLPPFAAANFIIKYQ